jgi:hypothetical protein
MSTPKFEEQTVAKNLQSEVIGLVLAFTAHFIEGISSF